MVVKTRVHLCLLVMKTRLGSSPVDNVNLLLSNESFKTQIKNSFNWSAGEVAQVGSNRGPGAAASAADRRAAGPGGPGPEQVSTRMISITPPAGRSQYCRES
jgi:hypothetical protein